MTSPLFASILATGFAVALLHGAMPNHWLPFVLVGRRQGWSGPKAVAVTAIAGVGHVMATMLLGVLVVASGLAFGDSVRPVLPFLAGGLLIALGVYYLVRRGDGHLHLPFAGRLARTQGAPGEAGAVSDRAAVIGLFVFLSLSPCEAFLPLYLSGLRYGWRGFGVLSLVLAAGAVLSMTGLTALSLAGSRRFGLKSAERYESMILGAALCLLGVLVMVLEG
jgi:hypothetical protein